MGAKHFIKTQVIKAWQRIGARPALRKVNELLFDCALRGLGVLNFENHELSGEKFLITRLLPELLSKKSSLCFVDVGANEGKYSGELLASFPKAKILALEPNPRTFQRLTAHFRGGDIETINAAAGAEEGNLVLYDRDNCTEGSHASFYREVITDLHRCPAVEISVAVRKLDNLLSERDIQEIDLLKIDTEGHEMSVILGAEKLISEGRVSVIHIEFNEMNVISRTFLRDFCKKLVDYDCFRLLPKGMIPLEDRPVMMELFAFQNLVFIKKSMNRTRE